MYTQKSPQWAWNVLLKNSHGLTQRDLIQKVKKQNAAFTSFIHQRLAEIARGRLEYV